MQSNLKITDFRSARDFAAEEGGALFPTASSWEWFKRKYKRELLRSGQFISRRGRSGDLVGPDIHRVVLEIVRRPEGAGE